MKGSITVACDTTIGSQKFTASAISGLTIKGNTASFLATGKVLEKPANSPGTATINVTDNGSGNVSFTATVKAGFVTVCAPSNTVKGDVQILVAGRQPVCPRRPATSSSRSSSSTPRALPGRAVHGRSWRLPSPWPRRR